MLHSFAPIEYRISNLKFEIQTVRRRTHAPGGGPLPLRLLKCGSLIVLASATAVLAQPIPKLTAVSPEWIQRATSAELAFSGENLGRIDRFIVSGDSWVTLTNSEAGSKPAEIEASHGGLVAVEIRDHKNAHARISINSKAALGEREIRVVTPEGVSNPVLIHVGVLPEVTQSPGNSFLDKAQLLAKTPCVVSGKISAPSEVQYFTFHAKKGEDFVLEIAASRLGSALDSSLALLDSSGNELARSEDALGLDSLLFHTIPADGAYYIVLNDFRFRGGSDYFYRLNVGALPYVTSFFPLGGQRGHNVDVELEGHNLGPLKQLRLQIAPDAPLGRQDLRAHTERGISNPFPFEISDLPNFFEQEPNSAIDQADLVTVPVAINGRISSENDYDAFKFKAAKGEQLAFEIEARRFGSPLDALLTLTDEHGNVIAQNDDAAGADARIEHQFTESGDYVILVEDLLQHFGSNYVYRLTIRSPVPELAVRFSPDTPRIHRGGHLPIFCELTRSAGFNERVEIALENPVPGIFAEPLILPPDAPLTGTLFLVASDQAPLGSVPLRLKVLTRLNGQPLTRFAEPIFNDRPADAGYLTVLPAAPFQLRVESLAAETEQNEAASIAFAIERQAGFENDLKVSAEGFSAGRDPLSKSFQADPVTLKKIDTQGRLKLRAKLDSEIGIRPIYLKAEGTVAGQPVTEYSQPIPMSVQQVPFALNPTLKRISVTALPAGSNSAAGEATFTVKAERRGGFTSPIQLALKGVPPGVTATVSDIGENSGETSVKIVASEKAAAGKDYELLLTGTGQFRDRIYHQQTAPVKLVISAPEITAPTPLAKVSDRK